MSCFTPTFEAHFILFAPITISANYLNEGVLMAEISVGRKI